MQPAAAFVPPPYVPPAPPAPTPEPVPDLAKKAAREQAGGVKDTIESILVAFILAFVFRAFVVEAFVIPTGSMATTLLGAHTRYHCPDCGYDFTVNYQSPGNRGDDEDLNTPANGGPTPFDVYCPNCGYKVRNKSTESRELGPPVYYGDRILVLKYRYLLQKPRRWDVVVFKAPVKARFPGTTTIIDLPPRYDTNYIKRLIGTPGEAVMVLDGDIYIREPEDADRHFTVQPKPRDVQNAMWRLVYDNDYHPEGHLDRNGSEWTQPWQVSSGTGWDTANPATLGRTFAFDNPAGESRLEFAAEANPTAQGLSDYLVHNQYTPPGQPSPVRPRSPLADENRRNDIPVSDVDLRLTYARLAGTGPLTLTETKRGHTFTAVVTPTTATLFHEFAGKRTQVGAAYPLPAGSAPVRLELADADYRVALRVNDIDAARTTPDEFAPDLPALLAEFDAGTNGPPATVALSAASQKCAVSHLSLWRDVYYYNKNGPTWATPTRFPSGAQQLGPDEYFVMGDNSQLSSDARYWPDTVHLPDEHLDADAGRVPGRFLLGKAFYVYWPAGYKAAGWLPAFVPNFGAMRFIH